MSEKKEIKGEKRLRCILELYGLELFQSHFLWVVTPFAKKIPISILIWDFLFDHFKGSNVNC